MKVSPIENKSQIDDLVLESKKTNSLEIIDEKVVLFRNFFLDTVIPEFGVAISHIPGVSLEAELYSDSLGREACSNLIINYNLLTGLVNTNKKRYIGNSKFNFFYSRTKDLIDAIQFLKTRGVNFKKNYENLIEVFKSYVAQKDFKLSSNSQIISSLEGFKNQKAILNMDEPEIESKEKLEKNKDKINDEIFNRLCQSFIEELMGGSSSIADMDYEELIQLPSYARKSGDKFYARKVTLISLLREFEEKFSQDSKRKERIILIKNISELFFNLFESNKNKGVVELYNNYKDFAEGLQFFCDKFSISNEYKRILSNFSGKIKFYAVYLGRKHNLVLK